MQSIHLYLIPSFHFHSVFSVAEMFNSPSINVYSIIIAFTGKLTVLKLLIILIIGFGVLLYIIDLSSLRLSQLKIALTFGDDDEVDRKWDWKFMQDLDHEHRFLHRSYFIDTEGCRMPSFPVVDPEVDKFLFGVRPIRCGKPLTRSNNNYLWIDLNETEIESSYGIKHVDKLKCEYQSFQRKNDFQNEYAKSNRKVTFRHGDVVRVFDEFIRVACRLNGKNKEIYQDYHFFLKDEQTKSQLTDYKKENEAQSNKPMSVMVMGIDSVSRLNFHRRMNESVDVLLNDLKAIELYGFNKVADNTYPNLIPTLTGLDEIELMTACIPTKNDTFDRCNFIWKTFEEKNFATAYVEDMASLGLFQYLRQGFKSQPTDYSLRPVLIEMEHHIAKQKNVNTFLCMGKRRTFDILMEYAQKLINVLAKRLHFSFFWTASFTHDYLNFPTLIDADLADFLRAMQSSGALDNSFLILMSDHGIRWGSFRNTYQGMMEERQPFVFFVPPKRFSEQYPEAMRNLVRNRHRLTTHFDLYETLRDLADLKTIESRTIKERAKDLDETDPMPRGISLFLPVSESRSCYDAAIAPHWCTCHDREELQPTDPRVTEVARIIVDRINDLTKPYPECQRLRLNAVFSADLGTSNTSFRNGTNHFVDITVRLQTKPGLGEFEATARVHNTQNYEIAGTISRTNLYGKQSYCIDDSKLKLYCFCDNRM